MSLLLKRDEKLSDFGKWNFFRQIMGLHNYEVISYGLFCQSYAIEMRICQNTPFTFQYLFKYLVNYVYSFYNKFISDVRLSSPMFAVVTGTKNNPFTPERQNNRKHIP